MIRNQTDRLLRSKNRCVHESFADVVRTNPNNQAIRDEYGELAYHELLNMASKLARILREQGVERETRVIIHLPKSRDYVIAILAVLQAGGVYIPVDEHYPGERIAYMVKDSRAALIITTQALSRKLSGTGAGILHIEQIAWHESGDSSFISEKGNPDQAACIIYTSGSTGKPKGIVLSHRSLLNLALSGSIHFALERSDRFLQVSSISFSAALEELYPPLLTGCTIVFSSSGSSPPSIADLLRTMEQERVTVCELVTPLWHELIHAIEKGRAAPPSSLRLVITGGERPLLDKYEMWCRHGIKLIHVYGPTEYAATATYHHCEESADLKQLQPDAASEWRLSIGKPIANTAVYVLDENMNQVPPGAVGEIYISGDSLATCYVNKPGLTAEKFLPDPFANYPGARMYKSGDAGLFRSDGSLEFIGRMDSQLKIRGYRVEPAEVETALETHPKVKQAVVLGREDGLGGQHLVAFLVGRDEKIPSTGEWRAYLQDLLPAYMIPSFYVQVDHIPLTLHGKIDRQALLQKGEREKERAVERAAPCNGEEAKLLAIWRDTFGHAEIGCLDDFFDLGGHSLLALRIASRIREAFGIDLQPDAILQHRTIKEVAKMLEEGGERSGLAESLQEIKRKRQMFAGEIGSKAGIADCSPISISQNGIWFLQQLFPDSSLYNVPWRFAISGRLDVQLFEKTIAELVKRHPALRSNFRMVDGQVLMFVHPQRSIDLCYRDFRRKDTADISARVSRYLKEEASRPFDLEKDSLLRAYLARTGDREYVAMFNVHHIVFDGWSLEIFMQELGSIYSAFAAARPPELPEQRWTYGDYAMWQRERLQGERLEKELSYWVSKLGKIEGLLELADRSEQTDGPVNAGKTVAFTPLLDEQAIRIAAQTRKTTPFILLLAVFKVVLYDFTKQADVIVGVPAAGGRIVREFGSLIGYFVNTLVMRNTVDERLRFSQFLEQVKQTALEGYRHQEIPLDIVAQKVRAKRQKGRNPLFQADFLLEENPLRNVELAGLRISRLEDVDTGLSKFDLTWMMKQREKGIQVHAIFNTRLLSEARVNDIFSRFVNVLGVILDEPDTTIGELLSKEISG